MRVVVTGFVEDKKIQAIKGICAVSGLDLRGAKFVADDVERGRATEIDVEDRAAARVLDEHGVKWHLKPINVPLRDFAELLSRYRRDLAVGDLCDALLVAAEIHAEPAQP